MNVRKVVALCLIVLCVGVLCYFTINGAAWGIYELRPLHEQIIEGMDLGGGLSLVYEAVDLADPELSANLDKVISSVNFRLQSEGYENAVALRQGEGRIHVNIPANASGEKFGIDPSAVAGFIMSNGRLTFTDNDGNELFSGDDVVAVEPQAVSSNEAAGGQEYVVAFELNESATEIFANITTEYAGTDNTISILIDGETLSTAKVDVPILTGVSYINGHFTSTTAVRITNLIRSGSFPIDMNAVMSNTTQPLVGENAVERAMLYIFVALLLALIYIVIFYRLPGVIACLSTVIYLMLMLFCFSTMDWVRLTLPGLAGILLSVGIFVGSQIIVLEHLREELKHGKTIVTSITTSFSRAFVPVLDISLLLILVGTALLLSGFAAIDEFAITLMVGLALSFITSLYIMRGLLVLARGFNETPKTWIGSIKKDEPEKAQ